MLPGVLKPWTRPATPGKCSQREGLGLETPCLGDDDDDGLPASLEKSNFLNGDEINFSLSAKPELSQVKRILRNKSILD